MCPIYCSQLNFFYITSNQTSSWNHGLLRREAFRGTSPTLSPHQFSIRSSCNIIVSCLYATTHPLESLEINCEKHVFGNLAAHGHFGQLESMHQDYGICGSRTIGHQSSRDWKRNSKRKNTYSFSLLLLWVRKPNSRRHVKWRTFVTCRIYIRYII